jgi:hypothetical protein
MNELEKAQILLIASKFAKAETDKLRRHFNVISESEKENLLFVSKKYAKSEANEIRKSLEEKILNELVLTPGPQGFKGERGERGEKGDTGLRGIKGDQGFQGVPGEIGPIGLQGEKGDTGERGERGEQGIPGERGLRGERGEQGSAGIDGANGRDGSDGAKGETGERGPEGLPGRDGSQGIQGLKGNKGDRGEKGDQGIAGPIGPIGLTPDITHLEKRVTVFMDGAEKRMSRIAFNTVISSSPGSGEVNLHKLDDVDYASLKTATEGQALVYNATTGKWQAGTVSGGGGGGNTVATVSTSKLGELTEDDLIVVNVTGGVVTSNTVGTLTSALNSALAQISALEARIAALGG